jgi:hypothetical protein
MVAGAVAHPAELLAQVDGAPFRIGDLELRGFSASEGDRAAKVEFAPVLPEQIVGNSLAKRADPLRRSAGALRCGARHEPDP